MCYFKSAHQLHRVSHFQFCGCNKYQFLSLQHMNPVISLMYRVFHNIMTTAHQRTNPNNPIHKIRSKSHDGVLNSLINEMMGVYSFSSSTWV
mmetsp:Transcript_9595/g.17451  ORF Transcript_9595/g.17451 Transcript_9595/m.17451 type:complete len:92 (+) Transcript_9595:19-294(+)